MQEDVEDAVATFNEENENERNHIYESPDLEPAKEVHSLMQGRGF